jgi:redox-sensing transcriptional repressor
MGHRTATGWTGAFPETAASIRSTAVTSEPPPVDAAGPPPEPDVATPTVPSRRRIPEATVVRLPVYQRILEELLRSGTTTVSSEILASMARVNAAKVRKDLSLLGSFGTRGAGYDAAFLIEQIDRELGLDREWPVIIVGIGNLGRALAHSQGFTSRGFRVTALFDVDPEVIGEEIDGVPVRHIDDLGPFAALHPVSIGIIATPAPAAQAVADRLVDADVRSVLNFAPRVLTVPSDVQLRYVDLSIELQVMSFYRSRMAAADPAAAMPAIRSIGLSSSDLE